MPGVDVRTSLQAALDCQRPVGSTVGVGSFTHQDLPPVATPPEVSASRGRLVGTMADAFRYVAGRHRRPADDNCNDSGDAGVAALFPAPRRPHVGGIMRRAEATRLSRRRDSTGTGTLAGWRYRRSRRCRPACRRRRRVVRTTLVRLGCSSRSDLLDLELVGSRTMVPRHDTVLIFFERRSGRRPPELPSPSPSPSRHAAEAPTGSDVGA